MTLLIIARHGNTFAPGEEPRRIGARTDLPLVESGREQAKALGKFLSHKKLYPDVIYTSTLKRTQETARLALAEAGIKEPIYPLKIFDEIDYGPDENQSEKTVIERIGEQALKEWDEKAILPQGWNANTEEITRNWKEFAAQIIENDPESEEIVLVLTSNGIARFAPKIAENYDDFHKNNKLKLATGALGIIEFSKEKWHIHEWNTRPPAE